MLPLKMFNITTFFLLTLNVLSNSFLTYVFIKNHLNHFQLRANAIFIYYIINSFVLLRYISFAKVGGYVFLFVIVLHFLREDRVLQRIQKIAVLKG